MIGLKLRLNVLAAALVIAGTAWAIQGYGQLDVDRATSRPEWLWIGAACAAIGLLLLAAVNRRGDRAP